VSNSCSTFWHFFFLCCTVESLKTGHITSFCQNPPTFEVILCAKKWPFFLRRFNHPSWHLIRDSTPLVCWHLIRYSPGLLAPHPSPLVCWHLIPPGLLAPHPAPHPPGTSSGHLIRHLIHLSHKLPAKLEIDKLIFFH